jgi:hypothetical protein
MKKVLFILAGLLIIASGIMSVAAYEGHAVDVRAHVENALMINDYDVDFGTVFPQEALESQVIIGLSESFRGQERYSSVQYKVYWEPKPISDHPGALDPDNDTYYEAIWPFIELKAEGDTVYADPTTDGTGMILAGAGTLYNGDDECDMWHMILNPPVFDNWYNEATDPSTPSGILTNGKPGISDDQYVVTNEYLSCDKDQENPIGVPKTDLGNILKFQVIDILMDVPN